MRSKDQILLEERLGKIYEDKTCCGHGVNQQNELSRGEAELRMQLAAYAEEINQYAGALNHPDSKLYLFQAIENLNRTFKELKDKMYQ